MLTESILLEPDPPILGRHPAKMHPGLARRLVEDYSPVGGRVLDPFVGCGTTLWACAQAGRRALGVDIEPAFAAAASRYGLVLCADARRLPLRDGQADAVVTSPPYGEAIGRSGDRSPAKTAANKLRYERKRFGKAQSPHAVYGSSPKNLGALPLERRSGPCFVELMPGAVAEAVRVTKPGGFLAWVVKDQRRGRRQLGSFDLPGAIVRWGQDAGAVFCGRRFGVIPESRWTLWQRVNAERWGIPVPDVEHVIVLQKPS